MIYLDYFREISLISGKFSIIDMQKTPSTLLKNFYARDYKMSKHVKKYIVKLSFH